MTRDRFTNLASGALNLLSGAGLFLLVFGGL